MQPLQKTEKLNAVYYVIQQFHFWCYAPKNLTQGLEALAQPCVAAVFTVAETRQQWGCPLMDGGYPKHDL